MSEPFLQTMQLKNRNRIAVLNYIRRNRHTTKATLASVSGLTFMAIQKIIKELMDLGLVKAGDVVRVGNVGRKAVTYDIVESYGYTAGLHINMFKTTAAVMDLHGRILASREIDMAHAPSAPGELIERFCEALHDVIGGISRQKLLGLGIGAPGPVNPREGMILSPPNMPVLRYLPICQIMEERFHTPVLLSKDTNAIAMGEYWRGAGAGHADMIYIDADMGIGNGLIQMGVLQEGFNYVAGEFGHLTVEPSGPLCNCGNHGCLESLASGIAILRQARAHLAQHADHPLHAERDALTIQRVIGAAMDGDLAMISLLNQAAFYMGGALASLINILDPEVIIVGGVLVLEYEPYLNIVRDTALKRRMAGQRENRIVCSQCGQQAGVVGAGELVANLFFSQLIGDVLQRGEG